MLMPLISEKPWRGETFTVHGYEEIKNKMLTGDGVAKRARNFERNGSQRTQERRSISTFSPFIQSFLQTAETMLLQSGRANIMKYFFLTGSQRMNFPSVS